MKNYISYMDRQDISPEAHEKLLDLTVSRRRSHPWARYGALAACAALIVGVGAWRLLPGAAKAPAEDVKSSGQFAPDYAPQPGEKDVVGLEDRDPSAAVKDQLTLDNETKGEVDRGAAADFHGFVADSGQALDKMMLPMLPTIAYPDTTGSPQVAADFVAPDGSFSVDLSQRDIELMLWGSEEAMEQAHFKEKPGNVPWLLFWDGFTISGRATYDGQGKLWQAYLGGYREDESFEILMAPGELPPTCIARDDGEVTDVRGVKVEGWSSYYDSDGDGTKEYRFESAFIAHDVGIRATFITPKDDGFLSSLFINWSTYPNSGLVLDHLMTAADIPAWREEEFSTLDQARQEAEFAPYLPTREPEGYSAYTGNKEFYGRLSYQEGERNTLWVRWSRGYDNVEVDVSRDGYYPCSMADPSRPETYDLRLYPIPWCDSMPEQYREVVDRPAFLAEDMSLAIVEARGHAHDTGGMTFSFDVVHPDGTVVSYNCDGLTAEQVWAMVEETL